MGVATLAIEIQWLSFALINMLLKKQLEKTLKITCASQSKKSDEKEKRRRNKQLPSVLCYMQTQKARDVWNFIAALQILKITKLSVKNNNKTQVVLNQNKLNLWKWMDLTLRSVFSRCFLRGIERYTWLSNLP